jgi:hypothetical protein
MKITKNNVIGAISKAELQMSNINKSTLNVPGFSSPKIKHLLNNLVNNETNYLEIGVFKGSTFVAALSNNTPNSAYAIDNWSEFNDYGNIKEEFLENTKNSNLPSFKFTESDCFKFDLSIIDNKINMFFFDGEHTYESHYNALKYYLPVLDDTFIFIVDDFDPYDNNWAAVEKGTRDSIKDLNLTTIYENHIHSSGRNDSQTWWNGLYVSILAKPI